MQLFKKLIDDIFSVCLFNFVRVQLLEVMNFGRRVEELVFKNSIEAEHS